MTCRSGANARKFLNDINGSSTVEFVIALPILLAMLAFAVQYGNALKIRNNLDMASRDAARYLARAPLNAAGNDVDVFFKNTAQQLVSSRVTGTKNTISAFTSVSDATSATVDVTIDVPFPLLQWIGLLDPEHATLSMSASETWSRTGDGVITTSTSGSGSLSSMSGL